MTEPAVVYEPTGRIRFRIDGTRYTLRPVLLADYRRILDTLNEVNDEILRRQQEFKAQPEESDLEAVLAYRKRHRESDRELSDLAVEQMREVFVLLSDKPLPEDSDTWPSWITGSRTLMAEMMEHWRTVPLDHG